MNLRFPVPAILLTTLAAAFLAVPASGDENKKATRTVATLKVEGMADADADPAAVTAALKGCEGVGKVDLDFRRKEAKVEFDPAKSTVHDLRKALKKTGKFTATLNRAVETSQEAGGAVWSAGTDEPAFAPGDKGKVVLIIDCGKIELEAGYKVTFKAPDGVKLTETTKEWKFGVAGSVHVPVEFELGKDVDASQLLVHLSIECKPTMKGDKVTLELDAVVTVEKAKK